MRIALAGGTGTLGRHVAEELRSRGHQVRVLSRSSPDHRVDLTTGEGLDEALKGCDAVADASNASSAKQAVRTFVEGHATAARRRGDRGVGHHVCVSVIGYDRVPMGYFRIKAEQEPAMESEQVPWTIVRATQFHELLATTLASVGRSPDTAPCCCRCRCPVGPGAYCATAR